MMSKILLIHIWLILTLLVGSANCFVPGQNRKVRFDEEFTLHPGEMVETENEKLKIRLKGVGRKISSEGEVEYVELQVFLEKSERLIVISERTKGEEAIGDYVIKLNNAESFGEAHCRLTISRRVKKTENQG